MARDDALVPVAILQALVLLKLVEEVGDVDRHQSPYSREELDPQVLEM